MRIAIVTDESRTKFLPTIEGQLEDAQKARTIKSLKEVISSKYDCIDLVFDDNLIENLKKEKIDLVFNLCNGIRGGSRLSQLPSLLEHEGFLYTGSGPLGHGLAYSKIYSGMIFKQLGIPTPDFTYVHTIEELNGIKIDYPLFVKPSDEGSSRGIYQDSIVYDKESLYKKVEKLLKEYDSPAMIMEFIHGKEFTVGIIENGNIVLPVMEIDFSELPEGFHKIYSFEVKNEYKHAKKHYVPARISKDLEDKIKETALRAFKALNLRDYARVDIRVMDDIPYVIEINSLPGLDRENSNISKMAKVAGIGYEGLVLGIVECALSH